MAGLGEGRNSVFMVVATLLWIEIYHLAVLFADCGKCELWSNLVFWWSLVSGFLK